MTVDSGVIRGEDGITRCWWADSAPEYRAYHDTEWGFPVDDDVRLFEKLSLEGFQAGLSWLTILRKREAFRKAFKGFDPAKVARFGERDVNRLLGGRVDHPPPRQDRGGHQQRRGGCSSCRTPRARSRRTCGASSHRREPMLTRARRLPATAEESHALAKDLKRRGWRFVGPTTVYAFMQAMGLVNDHLEGCDAAKAVAKARRPISSAAMKAVLERVLDGRVERVQPEQRQRLR